MTKLFDRLHGLLFQPLTVLWFCLAFSAASILFDGSFLQLWGLHRDHAHLEKRISDAKEKSRQLEFRLQQAQQPEFIERQARDQLDLVKEGDLVFVFADE